MSSSTLSQALATSLATDGARPLLTWLGPGGERVELSVRTFENNVAKAANLLQDDAGADSSSAVLIDLPTHWQTIVWLGACAAVGTEARLGGDASDRDVVLAVVGPAAVRSGAPITLASSLHPLGMPYAETLPTGVLDAATEVRAHGDRFTAYDAPVPGSPWLRDAAATLTQHEAFDCARALAASQGLATGARVLLPVAAGRIDLATAVAALALPLVLDGSVVLLADPAADLSRTAESERCTDVLA